MADIVNLRQMKKQRKQAEAAAEARENRIRYGRSKAAKANDKRAEERRTALLNASRRGEASE
jgi:hypothetical protein